MARATIERLRGMVRWLELRGADSRGVSNRGLLSDAEDGALTRASALSLARRIPLLYSIVLVNSVVLACTFYGAAPRWLSLAPPIAISLIVLARTGYWLPGLVSTRPTLQLRRDLASVELVVPAVGCGCTAWALALYRYGDLQQQSMVHYLVAVTCFVSILGLIQSPIAAKRLTIATIVPSTIWFIFGHHPNAFEVCAIQIILSAILLLITNGYHQHFLDLERTKQELLFRGQEATELAEAMRNHAVTDSLTGVANRRAILQTLDGLLNDETGPQPWLALVDLDGFKQVNDTFGHSAGDAVLRAVCERIGQIGELAAFGRLGGDEFALLFPGHLQPAAVHLALNRLMADIARPIYVDRQRLSVTASIGLRRTEGCNNEECLEQADEALYKAKRTPGGSVVEFVPADKQAMWERAAVTRLFCSASLQDQIALVFQPVIDFDSGKSVGAEALARWSPDGTHWIPPSQFIKLAEGTGRIGELTELVLARALKDCPVWRFGGTLSVNLSALDVLQEDAVDWISSIVERANAPPSGLMLEITETALIADTRRAADNLGKLRARGFRIALDDFGTGQSSLSLVHRLPLDHIKIDRSFTLDLQSSPEAHAVAATILALARQLKLECSIEGIETAEQGAIARALGIRLMQGFYFGKGASAQELLHQMAPAAELRISGTL